MDLIASMSVFRRVVEACSFSSAAREIGLSLYYYSWLKLKSIYKAYFSPPDWNPAGMLP